VYYVNQESILKRLGCIPEIAEASADLSRSWQGTLLQGLSQERVLHLAAEIATDVGSDLIDGFLMRDASSYEDIIDIIAMEGVVGAEIAAPLRELVGLRRSLVQDYFDWPRRELHPQTSRLADVMTAFGRQVETYLKAELF
jgi:uncharacterized protein YutE (UPF0331/DUF86 family)